MRISDWSSDVCSSDLDHVDHLVPVARELAFNLRDFGSGGAYGHYFNGPSTLDLRPDDFVVLELERLTPLPHPLTVIVIAVLTPVPQALSLSPRATPPSPPSHPPPPPLTPPHPPPPPPP